VGQLRVTGIARHGQLHAYEGCRKNISRPPSEYLLSFYYDTVNFGRRALQLAVEFAGAERLLAGSDYPHQIGSLRSMVDSIEELDVSREARAGILGMNASRLLGL
jgi:aminocarboxymuconate-semialdehyde decarboxylase